MEEGSRKIQKLRKEPVLYSFPQDGFMMARMDFESINNLNSKVTFIFSDLFKKYSVNEDISSEDISDKKIIKGNSRIVFEGLGAFNDRYVLVLHGEDVNIPYDEKDENANRVEVQADAELVAVTPSGMEVVIIGVCQSDKRGTDIVFDINENARNFMYNTGDNKIFVRINSVLVGMEDFKASVNLGNGQYKADMNFDLARNCIENAFEGRLEYKSGGKSADTIPNMRKNIIEDEALMENYTPETGLSQKPFYDAQILCESMNENHYYAVVKEVWKGVKGDKEIHFYRTHKVTADKDNVSWIISKDEIIK